MKATTARLLTLGVASLALAVAACGGDDDASDAPASSDSPSANRGGAADQ